MATETNEPMPATAHFCPDIEHYREDARRLRKMLGELEASNEMLASERDRLCRVVEDQQRVIKRLQAADSFVANIAAVSKSIEVKYGAVLDGPTRGPSINETLALTRADIDGMSREQLNAALRVAVDLARSARGAR